MGKIEDNLEVLMTKHFDMDGHRYDMHIVKKNEKDNSFEVYFFKSAGKINDIKNKSKEKGIINFPMKMVKNIEEFNS